MYHDQQSSDKQNMSSAVHLMHLVLLDEPDECAIQPSGGIKVLLCLHFVRSQAPHNHCSSLLVEPCYEGGQITPLHPPAPQNTLMAPLIHPT